MGGQRPPKAGERGLSLMGESALLNGSLPANTPEAQKWTRINANGKTIFTGGNGENGVRAFRVFRARARSLLAGDLTPLWDGLSPARRLLPPAKTPRGLGNRPSRHDPVRQTRRANASP